MVLIVIPARYASSRLPGKPLIELLGKPMIQHVYERCAASRVADRVVVATDDVRVEDCVQSFGGTVVMTGVQHPSGTDRVAEAVRIVLGDDIDGARHVVVNVQGDEPLIDPRLLDQLARTVHDDGASTATAVTPILTSRELFDTNVVKAVTRGDGVPLYFSRSPIPCLRDLPPERWVSFAAYQRHIGVYAYDLPALQTFVSAPPTPLETAEQLEQLRFLELGLHMVCLSTDYAGHAVDTAEDVMRVEAIMRETTG